MKKWQWKSSAVLLTGALTFGTPVSALAEVENRAAAESMSKEESHEEKIGAASEVKETDSDENTEPEKGETAPDTGEESAADRESEKESEKIQYRIRRMHPNRKQMEKKRRNQKK